MKLLLVISLICLLVILEMLVTYYWKPKYIRKLGRMYPNADCTSFEEWQEFLKHERNRLKQLRKPNIKSSVYPEPQTFNEWQEHLRKERAKIWAKKIGNEDLIDIERD